MARSARRSSRCSAVTGLDLLELSGMIGRQLPLFSLLVPFWLIWAFAGFRGMMDDLAGDPGRGPELRDPAVSGVQLSRPVAGGRRRRPRLHGLPDALPAGLETEGEMDFYLAQGARNRLRHAGGSGRRRARCCGERHDFQAPRPEDGHARLDAVDHPHGLRVCLGHPRHQEDARRDLGLQDPVRGPAQHDPEGAAGGRPRRTRRRRSTTSTGCPQPAPASSFPP